MMVDDLKNINEVDHQPIREKFYSSNNLLQTTLFLTSCGGKTLEILDVIPIYKQDKFMTTGD
jgi:hypothetical protein